MFYNNLHQAFHHGKKTLGDLYNGAMKYAGQLDHAFNVGKRLYGAIHPLLGSGANKAIMSGIQQIDEGRHAVVSHHNNIENHLNRIRKTVPEIGL